MIDSKGTHRQIFSSVQSSDVQSYLQKLRAIRQDLGIPVESNLGCKGLIFLENPDIAQAGTDFYGRDLYIVEQGLRPAKSYENRSELRYAAARGGETDDAMDKPRPIYCLIRSMRVERMIERRRIFPSGERR